MIRTVLGDIEKIDGSILMHEHIQCVSDSMLRIFGNKWLDEKQMEDYASEVLSAIKKELGVSVYVDGTPSDLGRNAKLLRNISKRTGVHIVASSGLYHFPSALTSARTPEQLAEIFLSECFDGLEGTDIRPGILKCAAGGSRLTDDEKIRLTAIGITQKKTGLSIYVHSCHKENVTNEIIDILTESGADTSKIVIGHAALRPDAVFWEAIIKRGCYVCIDQCFPENKEILEQVAKSVYKLCTRGLDEYVICSLDRSIYCDFAPSDNTGLNHSADYHISNIAFLFEGMLPAFERHGCTKEQCKKFVHDNPLKVLSI